MREWSIRIFLVGPGGEELPANIFDKVTYKLHPTFINPTRGTFCIPVPGGAGSKRELAKERTVVEWVLMQFGV